MILVADVGNTNITLGVYDAGKIIANWRLSSQVASTEDEIYVRIRLLCEAMSISLDKVKGMAVGSVVPSVSVTMKRFAEKWLDVNYLEVSAASNVGLEILYDKPENVGADRICNAVAGYKLFGGPLIVVDFGTATTFDIISREGAYSGGLIAPGLESAVNSLHRFAAKLPLVDLQFPKQLIGKTTESSMQAGLMYGGAEMVEGLIRCLKDEINDNPAVIATGGLANTLLPRTPSVDRVIPFLTLDGLLQIYEMNFHG